MDGRAGRICPTLVVSLWKVSTDIQPFSIHISDSWPGFKDPWWFSVIYPFSRVTLDHSDNPLLWNALHCKVSFFPFFFYLVTFTEINLVDGVRYCRGLKPSPSFRRNLSQTLLHFLILRSTLPLARMRQGAGWGSGYLGNEMPSSVHVIACAEKMATRTFQWQEIKDSD